MKKKRVNRSEEAILGTGIEGLDDILAGGLRKGHLYLLEGDPGTGKTTMALQFLRAASPGERTLYISLSESTAELEIAARSHGWSLDNVPVFEFTPSEASLKSSEQYTVFHPSDVELQGTIQKITEKIEAERPDRVVIDALSELQLLASDAVRYRRQLLALKQFFAGRRITVLMLDDMTSHNHDKQLQSIAHGVIRLEKLPRSYGVTRRRIEILKMRGLAYREGFHDYRILRGGVVVYPRLVAAEHDHPVPEGHVSTGIPELDRLLGGGVVNGSSTFITGPTGSGKSAIAMQCALSCANNGHKAAVFVFDEVRRIAIARARGLGMEIAGALNRKTLEIIQVDPAELSPGELVALVREGVSKRDIRAVVIDSLNGFLAAMPNEADMVLHLHELLSYLNQLGVATFLIMSQHGLVGSMQAEVDVSYLSDTVLLIRYFEVEGSIRRSISALKKRTGEHESMLRELRFDKRGIHIGKPLSNFRGVLTGVPELLGPAERRSRKKKG